MKIHKLVFFVGILLASLSLSAQADTAVDTNSNANVTEKPAADNAQSTAPSITPTAPQGTLADHQIPKLSLSWNCGKCKPNEKVFPLLEEGYSNEAISKGYTVSDAETAEAVITQYRQRPPGMRIMFGAFAGKDVLTLHITYRGKEYIVEDYEANSFVGMNGLSASVAKKAVEKIISTLEAQ